MSGPHSASAISTRLFRDLDEITREPGYLPDHPIDRSSYAGIIGHYDFKEEIRCCRKRDTGQLCNEGHKKGFVVRLKDRSVTIVGNTCATTRFGEGAQIRDDANRLTNEIVRLERIARFGELLGNRDEILHTLRGRNELTDALAKRVSTITNTLGKQTTLRLRDMAKTGNGAVTIQAITKRTHTDSNGDEETETLRTPVRIGSVVGLKLLDPASFSAVFNGRLRIEQAYTRAKKLEGNPKSAELKDLISIMADHPRIVDRADELLAIEPIFDTNDLSLLCYLAADPVERMMAATLVCGRLGLPTDRAQVRQWLDGKDGAYRERYNATSLGFS